jgi:hypothetical protein
LTRFSDRFGIGITQPGLDFIDIPLDGDLPVYLDPFPTSPGTNEFSQIRNDLMDYLFQRIISCIRNDDTRRAERMVSGLSEPRQSAQRYF